MIELYNEDCIERLRKIGDGTIDCILTDPPYGIDYQSQRRLDKSKRFKHIKGDKMVDTSFVTELKRLLKPNGSVYIFTRWDVQQCFIDAMTENGMKPRNVIIWDKCQRSMGDLKRAYAYGYESIIFYSADEFRFQGCRPKDIVVCKRVKPSSLKHPTQKPVELMERLINDAVPQNGIVLDCFMGVGSTGVACKNTGRNFIGIEIDNNYFDIAQKRLIG